MSLLDLKPESSEVGTGQLTLGGFAYLGGRVMVNGESCEKWIGASAPSRVVYKLPPGIRAFSATGVSTGGNTLRIGDAGRLWARRDSGRGSVMGAKSS